MIEDNTPDPSENDDQTQGTNKLDEPSLQEDLDEVLDKHGLSGALLIGWNGEQQTLSTSGDVELGDAIYNLEDAKQTLWLNMRGMRLLKQAATPSQVSVETGTEEADPLRKARLNIIGYLNSKEEGKAFLREIAREHDMEEDFVEEALEELDEEDVVNLTVSHVEAQDPDNGEERKRTVAVELVTEGEQ